MLEPDIVELDSSDSDDNIHETKVNFTLRIMCYLIEVNNLQVPLCVPKRLCFQNIFFLFL